MKNKIFLLLLLLISLSMFMTSCSDTISNDDEVQDDSNDVQQLIDQKNSDSGVEEGANLVPPPLPN